MDSEMKPISAHPVNCTKEGYVVTAKSDAENVHIYKGNCFGYENPYSRPLSRGGSRPPSQTSFLVQKDGDLRGLSCCRSDCSFYKES